MGVELTKQLADIAVTNMEKLGIDANIKNCDARNADDLDEYDVFYFYNPFSEDILQVVINHLLKSLKCKPRKMVVIYVNAICPKALNMNLKMIKTFRLKNQQLVNVYVADVTGSVIDLNSNVTRSLG